MTNTQTSFRAALMRGGTSKGLYFVASDLPADPAARDAVLLAAMGSPDVREIDGVGGGHPLTSKVAVVSKSDRPGIDVDYLFLQVWPDRAEVSDQQNCGNILAGVGPFAIEAGLVEAVDGVTPVAIYMVNTDSKATALVETPGRLVNYQGEARIDGVPGTHAPITINFEDVAGSSCGALLPTGNAVDVVEGVAVTMIDNGMPVVCLDASDFGLTGTETPAELEANAELKARVEAVRLAAGTLMNLGDVTNKTVPKMSLLSPARNGGLVGTRTFIPHRVHESIGVLGAVSVATACMLPGSVAHRIAETSGGGPSTPLGDHPSTPLGDHPSTPLGDPETSVPERSERSERSRGAAREVEVEHPTGFFTVSMEVDTSTTIPTVTKSALLRTARMLMRGEVQVPASLLENA